MDQLVNQENIEKNGILKQRIYKEKTWSEYIEYKKEKFDEFIMLDGMNSSINIVDIPNEKGFRRLMDILKDKYEDRFVESLIVDTGLSRLYFLCKSSGLYDMVNIIKMINEEFSSEYLAGYGIDIARSIVDRNRTGGKFVLHMSDKIRSITEKLSKDIGISQSKLGLICCILAFNRAKKEFEDMMTDTFDMYYSDNDYYESIKEDINYAARRHALQIVNCLPKMLGDIDNDMIIVKYNKERGNGIDSKIKARFIRKIEAMDEIVAIIERNKALLSNKTSLDTIVYIKNKLNATSF